MTLSLLLLLGQTAPPSVVLEADGFLVNGLGKEVREPFVKRTARPPGKVMYRKDDAYAVWDSRGLTVRHGSFSMSTKLPEVALTPKLFTKEQIGANKAAIAAGRRSKSASALSGSKRIADEVYFLLRWEEKPGRPWLEALVKVNLSLPKPKPELVGRFEGYTMAAGAVDEQLLLASAPKPETPEGPLEEPVDKPPPAMGPAAFVRLPDNSWGVATFDRLEKTFAFHPFGMRLLRVFPISSRLAFAAERTDYGKTRLVRVDVATGSRRELAELDGEPSLVDIHSPPLVRFSSLGTPFLRNVETGVQMGLPEKAVVRRTPAGILIWPEGKPQAAALYSPERFLKLAVVSKPTPPPASI